MRTESKLNSALAHRFSIWRWHHTEARRDTLSRLRRQLGSAVLTVLVIGVVMSIPASLSIVVTAFGDLVERLDRGDSVTLLLEDGLGSAKTSVLLDQITALPEVSSAAHVSKEDALSDLNAWLGLSDDAFDGMGNPLPDALLVRLNMSVSFDTDTLVERFTAFPGVAETVVDLAWLDRLQAAALLAERLLMVFIFIALLASLLIIGNTVRLAVESRRQEILVAKLVGASDAYVRRPFLYTGFVYGLGGGLTALGIVTAAGTWLSAPAQQLIDSYGADHISLFLNLSEATILLGASILLGMLGALVSSARQLASIEPK